MKHFATTETDHDDESEDVLLPKTPDDVVAVLGFDPLHLFDEEPDAPPVPEDTTQGELPHGPNHRAASIAVLRGAALMGVGRWLEERAAERFTMLETDLVALVKAGGNVPAIIADGQKLIDDAFGELGILFNDTMSKLVGTIHRQSVDALDAVHGVKGPETVNYAPEAMLVHGLTPSDSIGKMTADFALKFKAAIQLGVKAGDSPEQMAERIVSEVANENFANAGLGAIERLLDSVESGFTKLIQSAVQVLGRDIDALVAEAADVGEAEMGWQWVAVLDERVCDVCSHLDGSRWDESYEPVGDSEEFEDEPPLHPNCRCQLVAVDLSEAAQPTPKLDKFIEGNGPKAAEAVWGKSAVDAYRNGEINARELVSAGKPLSPDEFAEISAWMK